MTEYTPTTEEVKLAALSFTAIASEADWDRWLAAHDAEVRADAESDPSKDERLVRFMAMATPLGYQSALTVVQQMTALIDAETRARAAGVVAEEPEWEYGFSSGHGSVYYVGTRERVEAKVASFARAGAPMRPPEAIVRRRKVGLWVPVEQGEEGRE